MPPLDPPHVLVLAEKPELSRRWAEMLAELGSPVWKSLDEVPAALSVSVVVTDADAREKVQSRAVGATQERLLASVGVVTLPPAAWGDLSLPSDCTPRELCLACRAIGEVARLRSQLDESARIHQEIKQLAFTDPLTGLANRRAWDKQLQLKCKLAEVTQQALWLAIVDLDRFKQVNDAAGLSGGDSVLRAVAQSLAALLRHDDVIARLGGDEFGLLLSGMGEQQVHAVLDRLRAAVVAQRTPDGVGRLSASIGYAGDTAAIELFAAAERALREAKSAGGDCAVRGPTAASGDANPSANER